MRPAPSAKPPPARYHVDCLILQTRDPWWIHAYWEVTSPTADRVRSTLGAESGSAWLALRIYEEGGPWFDVDLDAGALLFDWTVQVRPHRAWVAEIGWKTPSGRFAALTRSNRICTPPDIASDGLAEGIGASYPAHWGR